MKGPYTLTPYPFAATLELVGVTDRLTDRLSDRLTDRLSDRLSVKRVGKIIDGLRMGSGWAPGWALDELMDGLWMGSQISNSSKNNLRITNRHHLRRVILPRPERTRSADWTRHAWDHEPAKSTLGVKVVSALELQHEI